MRQAASTRFCLGLSLVRYSRLLVRIGTGCLLAAAWGCQSRPATLVRLKFVDETLLVANNELLHTNGNSIKGIQAQVEKNRRPPADTLVLHQAEAVHDSTRALVNYLRDLRERLLRRTGNEVHISKLDERSTVTAVLAGPTADSLQRQLNAHQSFLRRAAPAAAVPAAPDSSSLRPDFRDRPVASALVLLSECESHALVREEAALAALRASVAANMLNTRNPTIRLFAAAEASAVAPGATYRAELLLAGALNTNTRTVKMTANGAPVPVDAAGFGQVAFPVPALRGAARRRAEWVGTVTVPYVSYAGIRDTTFTVRVPYTITAPK